MPEVFQTKGLVYRGALDFYATRVPGGANAVRGALHEPSVVTFFDQAFVPGAWYDVRPIVAISRAAAQACVINHAQLVRENAAWLARRDIHGVYKFLLRLASPEAVALRLARASMQYFDFGKAESQMEGPKRCVAVQSGLPDALASWFAWAAEGFAPVALAAAGAKHVVAETKVHYAPPPTHASVRLVLRWQ